MEMNMNRNYKKIWFVCKRVQRTKNFYKLLLLLQLSYALFMNCGYHVFYSIFTIDIFIEMATT